MLVMRETVGLVVRQPTVVPPPSSGGCLARGLFEASADRLVDADRAHAHRPLSPRDSYPHCEQISGAPGRRPIRKRNRRPSTQVFHRGPPRDRAHARPTRRDLSVDGLVGASASALHQPASPPSLASCMSILSFIWVLPLPGVDAPRLLDQPFSLVAVVSAGQ